ncbi:MAG TPA: phosphoribosyltransferase family protein [Candidatus Binatia bacterium]|jgi:putative phosphoribosyl transferase
MRFRSREHAAQILAERLSGAYKNKNPLILGIPRGALPMAEIIADALGGELDVVLVHKLSHPDQPEFAVGAIDESGRIYLADWATELTPQLLEDEKQRQLDVLRRRRNLYTPLRPPTDPLGRIAIVVDDGIATGSTMIAALRAVRTKRPKKLICAVAVASPQALHAMSREADAVVCLTAPAEFFAVGQFFDDFAQVSDEDVVVILQRHKAAAAGAVAS